MRPRRQLVPFCGILLALLLGSSAGSAAGSSRHAVACAQPVGPQVAFDAAGDAVAVWLCLRPRWSVQAAVRPAGARSWGASEEIGRGPSGTSLGDLALAVGRTGDAVAVWLRSSVSRDATHAFTSVVQAAVRPAGANAWNRAQDLSAPGVNAVSPQVAVDRTGNGVAVWSSSCENGAPDAACVGTIQAAVRQAAAGTWSNAEDVSAPGHTAWTPRVAIDPAGGAIVVWIGDRGFVRAAIRTSPGAGWSAPEDVGPTRVATVPPDVALDGAGNAIVVFVGGASLESAIRSSATGTWSRPEDLPSVGQSYPEFLQLALATNAAGEAVAVWRRGSEDAPPPVVQASVRSPGSGRWSVPQTLSDASADAGLPEVAVDAAGNAVAVWQDGVRTSPFVCPVEHCTGPAPDVEAAVLSAASETWTVQDRWHAAGAPQVTGDAVGDTLAVWVRAHGRGGVVQATDRTAASPVWTAPKRVSGVLCTVPRLVGLMLPSAEAALRGNACRTGRITYAYSHTARRGLILTQRRRPGMTLPEGTAVNVVVSRGRRNR